MFNQKSVLMLTLALLFVGCATTKGDWDHATKQNTASGYKQFIKTRPDTEFSEEAKRRLSNIEDVEWNKVQKLDHIASYSEFISLYPNTTHLSELKTRVKSILKKTAYEVCGNDVHRLKPIKGKTNLFTLSGEHSSFLTGMMTEMAAQGVGGSLEVRTTNGVIKLKFYGDPTAPINLQTEKKDEKSYDLIYITGTGLMIAGDGKLVYCFNVFDE